MDRLAPVWRVQDAEGRGPFRPGFSRRWSDAEDGDAPPRPRPFWEELGWSLASVPLRAFPGEHLGSACRSLAGLAWWLTPTEATRLARFGYQIVTLVPTRIVGESESQVVIARLTPFREGALVVPWAALDAARPLVDTRG